MAIQRKLPTPAAPEMMVLVGGMKVLNTNWDNSEHVVFTTRPEVLMLMRSLQPGQ